MGWYKRPMLGFHIRSLSSLVILAAVSLTTAVSCEKSGKTTANTAESTNPQQTAPEAPKPPPVQPQKVQVDARLVAAQLGVQAVQKAADLFASNKKTFPSGLNTLRKEALISPRGELDPWGSRYQLIAVYEANAQAGVKVCSAGPDKKADTPDDICSKPGK